MIQWISGYEYAKGVSISASSSCEHKLRYTLNTCSIKCLLSLLPMDTEKRVLHQIWCFRKITTNPQLKSQVHADLTSVDPEAAAARQRKTGFDKTRQYEVWCVYLSVRLHFTNTTFITDNPLELLYTSQCFCTVCSCVFKDHLHNFLANVFYFSLMALARYASLVNIKLQLGPVQKCKRHFVYLLG